MGSIYKEAEIGRNADFVWDAIRDVGAIHRRLVPGFVVDCKLEGDSRFLTFANGMAVRELIVAVDDKTRRHAWSPQPNHQTHHKKTNQNKAGGADKCRVVWIADVMPNEVAGTVGEMMSQGLSTMKRTLEGFPR